MANAFNMLRPNDLIWPYVVNVYMKGHAPFPFDLLYWNSDSTRMPAANHAFYLRNCYLENKLAKGEMELGGVHAGPEEGEDPDLQSRGARGPYRPCPLRVRRLEGLRRAGRIRARRIGTYRRRRQPGHQAQIPVLDRRAGRGRARGLDRQGATRSPAHGGRTGSRGSRSRPRSACARESPAAASSKPLCDAPGTYVTATA